MDVCLEDFGDNNSPDIIHLLSLFQTPKVSKFQVKLPSSINNIEGVVRSCVQVAFDHHVEDVALECFEDVYLPSKIFNSSSLAMLNLVEGNIILPPVVSLPLLRTLVLERICIGVELEKLISKCPSLESISVKECYSITDDTLTICHTYLRSLVLTMRYCRLRFKTPGLKFL